MFGLSCLLALLTRENLRAQGALTNGWMHTGTIAPVGDSDSWTFAASAGDSIVIRIGEISQTNSFTPRIRLQNPSAVQIGSASGAVAAEIAVTATNTGTFTVIVDDLNGTSATGTYRLTLAKTGSPVFVAPGDEGGPLTNGWMHTGTIDVGDLDVWTVSATAGQAIVIRMGEGTNNSSLAPWVRIYGPNGGLLDTYNSSIGAEVAITATNSGDFLVVAGDFVNSGLGGVGPYRLTLAKTGDPVAVSPGDEGGPLTNGLMHTGTIDIGDLDVWTVSATAGQAIVIRMGEGTNNSSLAPWVRIYGPNGALLDTYNSSIGAEVAITATNSGTFLIVAADFFNSNLGGTGTYRLTLAKTGDPVAVSPGDEGGPLTNGWMHTGTIDIGDLDVWTVSATAGQAIVVRMGEVNSGSSLAPWVRIYGPNGALLDTYNSSIGAEVAITATNSGTFLIVAADFFNSNLGGTGPYRLTLAKTGDPVAVSPGDEGGPMTGAGIYNGTIDLGDLDVWSFTACAGDNISLRMDEVTFNGPLAPQLRLYGRDGTLLNSVSGSATAQINRTATNGGSYLVVAGDFVNSAFGGSGAYTLTVNGLSSGLKLCPLTFTGTNINVGGIGGIAGTNFVLLTHTNLATPVAAWTPIRTNQFDLFGVFNFTNVSALGDPQRFFTLRTP